MKVGDEETLATHLASNANAYASDASAPTRAAGVTVVIVSYEASATLPRCLEGLNAQRTSPARVLVVDNGSTDGSARIAEEAGADVLRSSTNLGFAVANNLAARRATTEWIALLNPDAYPDPTWLAELLAASRRWPGVDAFGSKQVDASDAARLDGVGDAYFFAGVPYRAGFGQPNVEAEEGEVFGPCAAAAMWRRERFLALGGFEERFFCYGEDVDLAYRHRLKGGRCVQASRAVVRHEGSAITGRRSDFTTYHGHRNRIWTYLRDTPLVLLIASLPIHLAINGYLLARLSLIGCGPAYRRAVLDAIVGAGPFLRERRRTHAQAVSTLTVARALTWSPSSLLTRKAKTWTRR